MSLIVLLKRIYSKLHRFCIINWHATIRANFSLLNFKDALKLPIYVYGRTCIKSLKGKIVFEDGVERGKLHIGFKAVDLHSFAFAKNVLFINGTIKCKGVVLLGGGINLFVRYLDSVLEFGENVQVGSGTRIYARSHIKIEAYTQITMGCTIMDTNLHYVKNIDTGEIPISYGEIIIRDHCWINAGTIITKGVILPSYSIVARNSFLNKDYSNFGSYRMYVGAPAKPMDGHFQRIFNWDIERELDQQFKHSDAYSLYYSPEKIIEPNWSWRELI